MSLSDKIYAVMRTELPNEVTSLFINFGYNSTKLIGLDEDHHVVYSLNVDVITVDNHNAVIIPRKDKNNLVIYF